MRRAVLHSIAVTIAVALASRFAEWAFNKLAPYAGNLVKDLVGMSVAGLTAGILFFLWRRQQREKMRLLRERERTVRHVHHHVRNSLQVIVNRCHEDKMVVQHVEHILKELEHALPSRRQHPKSVDAKESAKRRISDDPIDRF